MPIMDVVLRFSENQCIVQCKPMCVSVIYINRRILFHFYIKINCNLLLLIELLLIALLCCYYYCMLKTVEAENVDEEDDTGEEDDADEDRQPHRSAYAGRGNVQAVRDARKPVGLNESFPRSDPLLLEFSAYLTTAGASERDAANKVNLLTITIISVIAKCILKYRQDGQEN